RLLEMRTARLLGLGLYRDDVRCPAACEEHVIEVAPAPITGHQRHAMAYAQLLLASEQLERARDPLLAGSAPCATCRILFASPAVRREEGEYPAESPHRGQLLRPRAAMVQQSTTRPSSTTIASLKRLTTGQTWFGTIETWSPIDTAAS